jgi:hypothetical protein
LVKAVPGTCAAGARASGRLVTLPGFGEYGCVTSSDGFRTVPGPALSQPSPRRGLGNVRSLVISMVLILAAVLTWVAMVPRVRAISQPAVDVTSVATQVRRETGWAISQPRLPSGWKATNVRFTQMTGGARTWHAGYLSPDGQYLSIDQTTSAGATGDWISARTTNGLAEGTVSAAGATWLRLSSRDIVQRSLLLKGSPLNGSASNGSASKGSVPQASVAKGLDAVGLTTVLSGTASYDQLVKFAESLEPVPVPAS